jgi:hypothetical protein
MGFRPFQERHVKHVRRTGGRAEPLVLGAAIVADAIQKAHHLSELGLHLGLVALERLRDGADGGERGGEGAERIDDSMGWMGCARENQNTWVRRHWQCVRAESAKINKNQKGKASCVCKQSTVNTNQQCQPPVRTAADRAVR